MSIPAPLRLPPYARLNSATTLVNGSDGDELSEGDISMEEILKSPPFSPRSAGEYFAVLCVLALVLLFRLNPTSTFSHASSSAAASSRPLVLPYTLVGPRHFSPPAPACSAEDFLHAVKHARLREDGKSRAINLAPVTDVTVQPLEFSFDFAEDSQCAPPHAYSQEEACDLLASFGGVYMLGDSYTRHILTALYIILRDRLDGATVDYLTTTDCRGDHMFAEGKTCRIRVPEDTGLLPPGVPDICGGRVQIRYVHRWADAGGVATDTVDYAMWRGRLPAEMQSRSPVFLESHGIHYNYNVPPLLTGWAAHLKNYISGNTFPRPLNIFAGPHQAPANQELGYIPTQGPVPIRNFAEQVDLWMRKAWSGTAASEGAGRYMDFVSATDGAASFDGCHLALQANLEKTHLLLNYLDILHREIVAAGGLVEVAPSA
ncbi:hypothetical protein JCM8097_001133 [Rhodosporidiobolus ruineniae]